MWLVGAVLTDRESSVNDISDMTGARLTGNWGLIKGSRGHPGAVKKTYTRQQRFDVKYYSGSGMSVVSKKDYDAATSLSVSNTIDGIENVYCSAEVIHLC
ncbi:unnamed protein product [Mesocestoides corti]|uniref:Neprosin domain-containing protein n=1 Tax=Mesocestoides corti TaxID=53468 RepID=A0A0R3UFU6_MESCO|nr:unnamed protein product [Mesocestoides corti]